jgi:hypothetical protein
MLLFLLPGRIATPQENVNRLKTYKSNLVVFPKRANKPKVPQSVFSSLLTAAYLKNQVNSLPKQHQQLFF